MDLHVGILCCISEWIGLQIQGSDQIVDHPQGLVLHFQPYKSLACTSLLSVKFLRP